jgi:hypothetical protein
MTLIEGLGREIGLWAGGLAMRQDCLDNYIYNVCVAMVFG